MQLLIVDDEIPAVQATKCAVDWEKAGVLSIFTAFDIVQAKKIICGHDIQLLLCDIEMPRGNGLELLEWIAAQGYQMESILLTCHADFSYAQKAISLGSLDYLLKPVIPADLEKVVDKAIGRLRGREKVKLWNQYHPVITERFWQEVINGRVPPKPQKIAQEASLRNIEYDPSLCLTPVLVKVQRWNEELDVDEERLMEFALKNSAEEILAEEKQKGIVMALDPGTLLALLWNEPEGHEKRCEEYIRLCTAYFCCSLSCYIGDPAGSHELAAGFRNLEELAAENVGLFNKIFTSRWKHSRLPSPLPQIHRMLNMLVSGQVEPALSDAGRYFDGLVEQELLNAAALNQYKREFQQQIFKLSIDNEIALDTLFDEAYSCKLEEKAAKSPEGMKKWLELLCRGFSDALFAKKTAQTDFDKIVRFIQMNVEGSLSCERIAHHMHFHPDYLTRMFKKKSGYTLSQYIVKERVDIAKKWLLQTDMSVGRIASRLGYTNAAQFCKAFKRVTGDTPGQYRQKHTGL